MRDNNTPDHAAHPNLLDDYVAAAPLNGTAYQVDNATVYTMIQHLISGNEEAESKLVSLNGTGDGRRCFQTLCDHYQGVGVLATEIVEAETTLSGLYYNGEKRPYMWWTEFERLLLHSYVIIDRAEGRPVYSNEQKLRRLMPKIKADFLSSQKASIEVELARIPITLTHATALDIFRNAVNNKFPPGNATATRTTCRNVRQVQHKGRTKSNL